MKSCPQCNKELSDSARYCASCGAFISTDGYSTNGTNSATDGYSTNGTNGTTDGYSSDEIKLCEDGKYRWVYEFGLFKNPTILFTLWKIFGGVVAGIWIFFSVIFALMGDFRNFGDFLDYTKSFVALAAGILVLSFVAYLVYALIMGMKYCVLFEMDEKGIVHKQLAHQVKKAHVLSVINILAGISRGNVGQIGIGILSARSSLTSSFDAVRSIQGIRKRNTIKVNEPFAKNQIYVSDKVYDFVYDYIVQRCPRAQIR